MAVAGLLYLIAAWPPLVQLILAVLAGAVVYAGTLYLQGPQRVRDIVGCFTECGEERLM